eukprot:2604112-Pyramimonas_sp.AAC.1
MGTSYAMGWVCAAHVYLPLRSVRQRIKKHRLGHPRPVREEPTPECKHDRSGERLDFCELDFLQTPSRPPPDPL